MRTAGERPPPDSIVMREGKRKPRDRLREEAEDEAAERRSGGIWDGRYRLSVFAGQLGASETPEGAVSRLFGAHRTVKFFRCAALSTLEDADFVLEASQPEPFHFDLVLGTELTDPVLQRFDGCFELDARRNPEWTSSR